MTISAAWVARRISTSAIDIAQGRVRPDQFTGKIVLKP